MRRGCNVPSDAAGAISVRTRCAARAARALLCMDFARRRTASRNALAAMTVALVTRAAPALADGAPNLVLPLVSAVAFASAASEAPRQVATLGPGNRPLLSLIPKQVHIVDGYEYDFDDYVGLSRPRRGTDAPLVAPGGTGRPRGPAGGAAGAPFAGAARAGGRDGRAASAPGREPQRPSRRRPPVTPSPAAPSPLARSSAGSTAGPRRSARRRP